MDKKHFVLHLLPSRQFPFVFVAFLFLTACSNQTDSKPKEDNPVDTTKSFKIDNDWVTPKSTFDLSSLSKSSDTLSIIICDEYVYSPFGLIKDKSDLQTSLLKNFSITNRVDSMDIGPIEFQILKLNSSRLILFFDHDPEAVKHSSIFKGEIKDSNVNFSNNTKIGMDKDNFYKIFFDNFPTVIQDKFKVVVFESCIQNIKHYYNFENNKLTSVKFVTDSYWTVNY
jgi:hypothetical protein